MRGAAYPAKTNMWCDGPVATLIYLAIQVRHGKASLDANTSSLRAQITQAHSLLPGSVEYTMHSSDPAARGNEILFGVRRKSQLAGPGRR